jgi:hypothetical protein
MKGGANEKSGRSRQMLAAPDARAREILNWKGFPNHKEGTMKRFGVVGLCAAALVLCLGATASAGTLVWNFTDSESNYYLDDANWVSGPPAYVNVPPISADDGGDSAAVLARINSQAPLLKLDNVVGAGFVIDNFATVVGSAGNVFGSLYLSTTGGSGANVLILTDASPYTGAGTGPLDYTFNLNTPADYRTWDPTLDGGQGDWTAYDPTRAGTLAQVIADIDASPYASEYVAFWGPQIGESGTSGTTFDVTQISLDVTPEPVSMIFFATGLVAVGGYVARRRMLRNA